MKHRKRGVPHRAEVENLHGLVTSTEGVCRSTAGEALQSPAHEKKKMGSEQKSKPRAWGWRIVGISGGPVFAQRLALGGKSKCLWV